MIRLLAFAVSLALHVSLFYQFADAAATGVVLEQPKTKTITRLSLAKSAPQPKPKPKRPKPPERAQKAKKLRPEPAPAPEPEPEVAPSPEPQEEEPLPQSEEETAGGYGIATDEEERERYIEIVLAAIERKKYYPKSARRRGVEGAASISFFVSHSGSVNDLKIKGELEDLRNCRPTSDLKGGALP